MIRFASVLLLVHFTIPTNVSAQGCATSQLAVQILGSGGPLVGQGRASSGYLVWIGARARILVDAGGGAFLRFGEAQARLDDLALIAISHLHPDHVSDLPALLWLSDLARKERLAIAGPSGNDAVPSFPTFLIRLFDQEKGAFQVLGATLGGSGRGVPLDVTVLDVTKREASTVLDREGVTVTGLGVPHANIPTIAYKVQVKGAFLVFGSDQTGTDPKFIEFARGAEVLVMHLAIAAGESSSFHASPATVGHVARDAHVGRLILSHFGQFDPEPAIKEVKKYYAGPVTVGIDLQCTPVL